jgi:hypothetical protein
MKWYFFVAVFVALMILTTIKVVRHIRWKKRAIRSIRQGIERVNRGDANPDRPTPRSRQEAGLPYTR